MLSEIFKMTDQNVDAKALREQLNMIYIKHALLTAKKIIKECNSSHLGEFCVNGNSFQAKYEYQ